jgi:hypothetical protein
MTAANAAALGINLNIDGCDGFSRLAHSFVLGPAVSVLRRA